MILRRTAVGAALIAAPLAFAAPAMAKPSGMNFDCAPCVGDINNDGKNDPVWNEVTSFGPWEKVWPGSDAKGAWENGVEAINGGAWEKAFPPAE
ncbi:hypothetical protein [Mycobacterium aquaticum]|uniref:Uncharacterized protein n=1 Tax=Mycobacterium aquaticum TaxID=1927124 RepID=A0A1X0AUE6_9MYCO|nr:hypothetical protein [Mycobacterium aquaticum]ORA33682.1 hypothetical protein BST13_19015 [Mycobacterium aquaticum]